MRNYRNQPSLFEEAKPMHQGARSNNTHYRRRDIVSPTHDTKNKKHPSIYEQK